MTVPAESGPSEGLGAILCLSQLLVVPAVPGTSLWHLTPVLCLSSHHLSCSEGTGHVTSGPAILREDLICHYIFTDLFPGLVQVVF